MGYYINTSPDGGALPARNKFDALVAAGATPIDQPKEWVPNLVCVVQNSIFDAAGYAFNDTEMRAFFPNRHDQRPRRWCLVPDAAKLAGYVPLP